MKNTILAGLVAAQLVATTSPAAAAGFGESPAVQTGTFAGARIRISLGGERHDRKFRAGLTLAPTLRSQTISGGTQLRFGEGLELGFTGKRPLTLSLAGVRADTVLGLNGRDRIDTDNRLRLSTGGKIAIGVGVILVAGGVGYLVMANRCTECDQ